MDALALDALADISALRSPEQEEEDSYSFNMSLEAEKSDLRSAGSASIDVLETGTVGTTLSTNAETVNGNLESLEDAVSSGTEEEADAGGSVSIQAEAETNTGDFSSLRRRWLLPRSSVRRPSDDDLSEFSKWGSFRCSGALNGLEMPNSGEDRLAADKLEKDVQVRGPVIIVKGFWRKTRSLAKRIAEIRLEEKSGEHQLCTYKVGKDGRRSLSSDLCINLIGAAVEATEDLPENPGHFGFRIFSLPDIGQDPLDLVVESSDERAKWLSALACAVEPPLPRSEEVPQTGTCHVTVVQATLSARLRRTADAGVFIVIRYNDRECRTVTRGLDAVSPLDSGEHEVAFGHAKELPIFDDDPDSLITFELWAANKRGSIGSKDKMLGCIEVPLFLFGRNGLQELNLPLRDAALVGVSCEESYAAGSIHIMGFFRQSFQSLFLPRPVRPRQVCYHLVDMPYKTQLKEFESFSSRFVHHCETWQRLSIRLKRLHQWNQPAVSFACLVAVTLIIVFLHEYIMPLGVLALLCAAAIRHPYCQKHLQRLQAFRPNSLFLSTICSHSIIPTAKVDALNSLGRAAAPAKTRQEGIAEGHMSANVEASAVPSVEIFENQRRHIFSSFKPQRLRPWLDPPPFSDLDGKAVEPPQDMKGGKPYTWQVDVSQFTDGEGWRYAKTFGQGAVWTNSFSAGGNVRRRRFIGRPVSSARGEYLSLGGNKSETNLSLGDPAIPTAVGVLDEPRLSESMAPEQTGKTLSWGRESWSLKDKESNSKSPQHAGTPKTPYQEMYRNLVLRAAYMRHHMEYWMDWYERRKNLLLGATSHTSSCVLVLLSGLLAAALLLPTRWLVLAFIYTFFWDGFVTGRLMRSNRKSFISQLKDRAVEHWLDGESSAKVQQWGEDTLLDEVTNTGVQDLKLCDWIKRAFFDGRPMVTLRAVQRCRTLGDLASVVTNASDKFSKRRQRKRVWYRSTVRNLLDHVPSDVTIFRSASATYQPPMKT